MEDEDERDPFRIARWHMEEVMARNAPHVERALDVRGSGGRCEEDQGERGGQNPHGDKPIGAAAAS
jgi:hypothetical protein